MGRELARGHPDQTAGRGGASDPPKAHGTTAVVKRFLGLGLLLVVVPVSGREARTPAAQPPGTGGSIEGIVRLLGRELPSPTPVLNTTDPETCAKIQTLDDLVVSPQNRGIRYAIVAVRDVPADAIPPFDAERVVLNNVDCRFSPHAAVATVGSTLEAVNSDPVLHTTHLYGPADVNISLPVEGARSTRLLEQPGTYIVKCDIHGWMQGFIRVDPHPFHAVTDETGAFRIKGVPGGDFVLEVWHEKLGVREVEVRVEAGAKVSLEIEYPYAEN